MSDEAVFDFLRSLEEGPSESHSDPRPPSSRRCPDCQEQLTWGQWRNYSLERCEQHGLWLGWDNQDPEFRQEVDLLKLGFLDETRPPKETDDQVLAYLGTLEEPERTRRGIANRPCPECDVIMSLTNTYGIEIDVCRTHGVWFDHGELEAFSKSKSSMAKLIYQRRRKAEQERLNGQSHSGGSTWNDSHNCNGSSFGSPDSSSGWDSGMDE